MRSRGVTWPRSASLATAGMVPSPPAFERVLFHLLREYARHVGHLDIVSELAGGQLGE
jgi:hypothetical protein